MSVACASQDVAAGRQTLLTVIVVLPTPEMVDVWNEAKGSPIGLFHVTC